MTNPNLFDGLRLGDLDLPNRVVMAPLKRLPPAQDADSDFLHLNEQVGRRVERRPRSSNP